MSKTQCQRLLLGAAAVLIAVPAFAQIEIQVRPRQLAGWDQRAREGRCEVRVWVDNRAEVRMRGDRFVIQTLQGAKARDEGSECSQPIPYHSVSGFQIRQTAGRSRVTLSEEPSRANNFTAMIAIDDRQGGGDNYAFEVTWRSEGEGADRPAPFFDEVRACQDLVRQRFLSANGRGAYLDFETFADRGVEQQRGPGRTESIRGRGHARSRNESRDLTYSCVVDSRHSQVVSGGYQFSGDPRSHGPSRLR